MKKLSVLFIALVAAALLFTPSCKSEDVFNIVGTWNVTLTVSGLGTITGTYTFTGTETSGTCSVNFPGEVETMNGPYTVTGLNVNLNLTWTTTVTHTATGTVSADFLSISGTFTQSNGFSGTWTATRPSV
jgi:hypothetical protein